MDRFLDKLTLDSSDRSHLDAVHSFIHLSHSIFDRRKIIDRHVEYFVETYEANMNTMKNIELAFDSDSDSRAMIDDIFNPSKVKLLLSDVLHSLKGNALLDSITELNAKTRTLVMDELPENEILRKQMFVKYSENYKELENNLKNNFRKNKKKTSEECNKDMNEIQLRFDSLNNDILSSLTTDEELLNDFSDHYAQISKEFSISARKKNKRVKLDLKL